MTRKEYIQKVDELWEWARAVLPVYGDTLFEAWTLTPMLFHDIEDNSIGNGEVRTYGESSYVLGQLEEVLSNPEDEYRLTLAMDAYLTGDGTTSGKNYTERFIDDEVREKRFKDYLIDTRDSLKGNA